ncbi:type IV toxin-antitoxin system YeeU family antitoxin, partial [Aeromonas veronii]
ERSHWSGNGVHVEPESVFMIGRNMQSDRASLNGEWSEVQIAKLDLAFPEIIKALEAKLLTGELDAQRQHCITIQHGGFTCEADTLGSHGYVYIAIYPAISADITHCAKA